MLTMLYVEYGAGAETADYNCVVVRLDGKKIVKKYNNFQTSIFELIWRFISKDKRKVIRYPYGYGGCKIMSEDIKRKEISI